MNSQTYRLHPATHWVSQLQSSLHTVLARLATRPASVPAQTAAEPNVFREAEALREYAATFVQSDPRFADDLFAAADRHETGVH